MCQAREWKPKPRDVYLDIVHSKAHKDIEQGDGNEDGKIVGVSSNDQYQHARNEDVNRIRHDLWEHLVYLAQIF